MPQCSKKRRSSVASAALTMRVGDVVERHGVVVQDAALADLVAVLIEELDGELAGEELALVEFVEGRNGEREHDDEAAGAERQSLRRRPRWRGASSR